MREWNNSRLMTLLMCGERFRRREIERDIVPSTIKAKRGTVVHATAAESHRRQMEALAKGLADLKAATLSPEEAGDMAATLFEDEAVEVTWSPADEAEGVAKVRGHQKDVAVGLSRFYAGSVAPLRVPVAVERKITLALGGDLKLHGTMDLITREVKEEVKLAVSLGKPLEPGDTEEVIRDLKSGESTPKANTARDSQQLTFYGLLRKAETGTSPGRYVLDHVVRKPGGTTQHIEQVTTRNDADVAALVQRIGAAVDAVQAGTFLPAAPTAWWCSSNWCEYFRSCRFVNPKEQ